MVTADFSKWASTDLVLSLYGETYTFHAPSVRRLEQLKAFAAMYDQDFGITTPLPDGTEWVALDDRPPIVLGGEAYEAMTEREVPAHTINRVALYVVHHWVRGREYADRAAQALWGEQTALEATSADAAQQPTKPRPRRRTTTKGARA